MESIARNFNVGVEIQESALNKVSAALYHAKPELFETAENILVEPNTGRVLGLYAFLDKPFAFNLYPIKNSDLEEGGIYVEAALSFTLTDKRNISDPGKIITRIRMRLQAAMELQEEISVAEQRIDIYLREIKFVDFTPDHPDGLQLPRIAGSMEIVSTANALPSTDPAFIAILNYLIDVFLKRALQKPLESFPFPAINLVLNTSVNLYMRSLSTWGNTLGTYLSLQNGGHLPIVGNLPSQPDDIAVGITEGVVTAVLNATLPVRSNITPTPENRTFSISSGSWIDIKRSMGPFRSAIDLQAPDRIRATFFFNAHINAQINIQLGKYWVRVGLPIPIGDPSMISGSFLSFVRDAGDKFELMMRPGARFFQDMGAIVIVTDYSRLIRDAVRDWLNRNVSPVLKKIPILGWIIAKGVESIVSELMRIFLGTPLDAMVSTFLSVILTVLYNVVRLAFGENLEFSVTDIKKRLLGNDIPVDIKSLTGPDIVGNAGGELVLKGNLDSPPIPVPDPPVPETPKEFFVVAEHSQEPRPATLSGDFLPRFPLPLPVWPDATSATYALALEIDGNVIRGTQTVWFSADAGAGEITLSVRTTINEDLENTSQSSVVVDAAGGRILRESQIVFAGNLSGPMAIKTDIVYDYAGNMAHRSLRFGTQAPIEEDIELPGGAVVIGSIQGVFQLQGALQLGSEGRAARLDFDGDSNSARFVPVKIAVKQTSKAIIGGVTYNIVEVVMEDEDFRSECGFLETHPYRFLRVAQSGDGVRMTTTYVPVAPE